MSNTELRDLIAAALQAADEDWISYTDPYPDMADAVIAKLGLRIERGERSKPTGTLWAKDNRYTVHRYVTEWQADDE